LRLSAAFLLAPIKCPPWWDIMQGHIFRYGKYLPYTFTYHRDTGIKIYVNS
jgi:hypothetical protein